MLVPMARWFRTQLLYTIKAKGVQLNNRSEPLFLFDYLVRGKVVKIRTLLELAWKIPYDC